MHHSFLHLDPRKLSRLDVVCQDSKKGKGKKQDCQNKP